MATPNIVPRADSEGGIGTASKYWASAYIDLIYVGAGKIGRDSTDLIDFSTDNSIIFKVNNANRLRLDASQMYPVTSDGVSLGTGTNMFSDLFLASGAVINFDNSNLTLTHTSNTLTLADGDVFALGTSRDLQLFHESENSYISNAIGDLTIRNLANDKDIIFQSDDGSGGVETYFFLDGSASSGSPNTTFPDNSYLNFGNSTDFFMVHDGSNTALTNQTGNLTISNSTDDGDIIFQCDDGSGGTATYFRLDGSEVETRFHKATLHYDNIQAKFGDSGDLQIVHNGTDSQITNTTGNLQFTNTANNSDISFASDNGAEGDAIYFYLDGSSATYSGGATTALYTNWPDKSRISLGTGHDLYMYHDGSNTYFENEVGNLTIFNKQDDGDITLASDDGSGGTTAYLTLDGSASQILIAKETVFGDAILASFGAGRDLRIQHSGDDAYVDNYTGDMYFRQQADDKDIIFQCDDGSGGVTAYLTLDGSSGNVGIGTASPSQLIEIKNNSTSWNQYAVIQLTTDASGGSIGHFVGSSSTADRGLFLSGSGGTTKHLFVNTNGNVGIGTTTPDSLFTLVGDAGILHQRFKESSTTIGFIGGANGIVSGHDGKMMVRGEAGLILSGQGNGTPFILDSSGNTTLSGDLAENGEQFVITSSNDEKPLIHIKDTTNSVNGGELKFTSDRGQAPVDGDDIGRITFTGEDAGQNATIYSQIVGEIHETAEGDESGELNFYVANDAVLRPGLQMHGDKTTSAQVDVTIANGAGSQTTVSGDLTVTGDVVMMANLPTSDPSNAGQLWANSGVVTVSAG